MTANKNEKIYVVEDEEDIAELIRYNLSHQGYSVTCFTSGETGLEAVQSNPPDLLLLDLMLPGLSGLEICESIRGHSSLNKVPIIMVTAKGEEADIVRGLELGADDYLTKPFSPKVLVARVGAVLRRSSQGREISPNDIVAIRGLRIDPGRHEVTLNDQKIDLTNSEFQILHFLALRPGWVFTRSQIVDAIRGENYAVTNRSIDFQMVGLRKKLGPMGEYIETVRGVGYRFREV